MTRVAGRPFVAGLVAVLVVVLVGIAVQAAFDAEKQSEPPHAAPADARVAIGPPPLAVAGADTPAGVIGDMSRWIEGVERERIAVEAQSSVGPNGRVAGVSVAGAGVGEGQCAELAAQFGLPESILWRESRCSTDAYNPTGCGGRGCVGAAQLDVGHFAPVSPWGGGVGGCSDLDAESVSDQQECTRRLSRDSTDLSPWR